MEYRWAGQKNSWSYSRNCPHYKPNIRLSSNFWTEIPIIIHTISYYFWLTVTLDPATFAISLVSRGSNDYYVWSVELLMFIRIYSSVLATKYRPSYLRRAWTVHGSPNLGSTCGNHRNLILLFWILDVSFYFEMTATSRPVMSKIEAKFPFLTL